MSANSYRIGSTHLDVAQLNLPRLNQALDRGFEQALSKVPGFITELFVFAPSDAERRYPHFLRSHIVMSS